LVERLSRHKPTDHFRRPPRAYPLSPHLQPSSPCGRTMEPAGLTSASERKMEGQTTARGGWVRNCTEGLLPLLLCTRSGDSDLCKDTSRSSDCCPQVSCWLGCQPVFSVQRPATTRPPHTTGSPPLRAHHTCSLTAQCTSTVHLCAVQQMGSIKTACTKPHVNTTASTVLPAGGSAFLNAASGVGCALYHITV